MSHQSKLDELVIELRVIESKLACADKRAKFQAAGRGSLAAESAARAGSYRDDVQWAAGRVREMLSMVDGVHTESGIRMRTIAVAPETVPAPVSEPSIPVEDEDDDPDGELPTVRRLVPARVA